MTATLDTTASSKPRQADDYWLFSRSVDLTAFVGSAALALLALGWGAQAGLLQGETPNWAWIPFILLVDVAHVYATGFRVYFDREELGRRPLLYFGVPVCSFILGLAVYSEGPGLFWRCLAYLAVFHFVRQQYGWVMLYRAKRGERDRWGKRIDSAAIYLATIYPLIYWHAHLPRNFWWFREQDFQALPQILATLAAPLYWTMMTAYAAKSIRAWWRGYPNPGKDIVLVTTAICWYVGIVTFNSDYAFTVTNVIIHGVPYIVLVYWYMQYRTSDDARHNSVSQRRKASGWKTIVLLLSTIWLLAYLEELVWDRALWNSRPWLFGEPLELGHFHYLLVPLLAVPQLTHYILDGFIWRRKSNPNFNLLNRNYRELRSDCEPLREPSSRGAVGSLQCGQPASPQIRELGREWNWTNERIADE